MQHSHSSDLFARAQRVIPGGVNSPVRAFRSVGADPIFYERAKGARVWDADGNEYIDFVASWGPMILGHAPDVVLDAVREQLDRGTSYGAPTEVEVRMAEAVCEAVPAGDVSPAEVRASGFAVVTGRQASGVGPRRGDSACRRDCHGGRRRCMAEGPCRCLARLS